MLIRREVVKVKFETFSQLLLTLQWLHCHRSPAWSPILRIIFTIPFPIMCKVQTQEKEAVCFDSIIILKHDLWFVKLLKCIVFRLSLFYPRIPLESRFGNTSLQSNESQVDFLPQNWYLQEYLHYKVQLLN